MTPLDQTLVDQMKTALSKSAPDLQIDVEATSKLEQPRLILMHSDQKYILLAKEGQAMLVISPSDLARINELAVKIGWQCD